MKKPKKPTKTSREKVLCSDILDEWDGLGLRELIVMLGDMLFECGNAKFKTNWNYDSTNCSIVGTEDDHDFDSRMKQYEEDMIAWRVHRIETLKRELEEVEGV